MQSPSITEQKVQQIIGELKKNGCWKKHAPDWVMNYEQKAIHCEQDFSEWLQFVYLPNCSAMPAGGKKHYIALQAMKFFGEDVRKGQLLQLLVELDALT